MTGTTWITESGFLETPLMITNTNGSGDIFLAFSTGNPGTFQREKFTKIVELPNDEINPLLDATVQAV